MLALLTTPLYNKPLPATVVIIPVALFCFLILRFNTSAIYILPDLSIAIAPGSLSEAFFANAPSPEKVGVPITLVIILVVASILRIEKSASSTI